MDKTETPSPSPASPFRRWLRRALPTGGSLAGASWVYRHTWICVLLWLHVPALLVVGLLSGETLAHTLAEIALIGLLAVVASSRKGTRDARAAAATLGLASSSAVLVHFTGGLIEAHFHFFVLVVVVSLYQSWLPFLLAIAVVALHHGIVGVIEPTSVYNHPAALASPWKWALVHAFFIACESVACLVSWRANEDALNRERATQTASQRVNRDLNEAQTLAKVGSWDWEVGSDIIWWSPQLYTLTGRDPERFTPGAESFLQLVHDDDRPRVRALLEAAVAKPGETGLAYECRLVRPDGAVVVVHCLGRWVRVGEKAPTSMVGTCQDITERHALQRAMEHQALHDSLTGLGNRALFLDRLDHALTLHKRSGAALSVLFIDLDDFKTVNDGLGHGKGDEILAEVGHRLQAEVRASDTVARLGGDEFAVLLEDTDVERAVEVAERIRDAVHAPMSLGDHLVSIQASMGIAPAVSSTTSPEVLRDADIAMYAAKEAGQGGCEVFTTAMRASVINRTQLREELNNALKLDQFVLHFQPVVNQQTGVVEAVEALVRWEHPERGLVPPADFIPLAEDTGLIVALGQWVTEQAARQTKALQRQLGVPLWVSVNLSPQQLCSDVVGMVRRALDASGLDARDLVLEITESTLLNHEGAIQQLETLRAEGVRVAVDDFGTGYSSLSYLRKLPVDVLKIDRSFVDCINDGPDEAAMVEAIIKLAHTLGLRTIAEGIETDEQDVTLRRLGSDAGQGYHLCRPLPAEALLDRLRERPRISA